MTEGTKLNPSTLPGGDTIDTELVGSVKLPRSKVALGARDVDDGDVASGNPMPIVGVVTVVGTPPVDVANFPATQPVSALALPLPAGAAADATLTGGAAKAQPVDASGNVLGTSGHPVRVDPVGTTPQPISAAALPLPTGAAIASAQTDGSQKTQVTNFPTTQPVSVATLPLPTGAALGSAQTDGTQKTQVVDATGHHLPAGDAAARAIVVALSDAIGAILGLASSPIRTDPTGTTTQPVSVASLPLPAGAAVASAQTDGSQKTQVVDAAGHEQPAGDAATRPMSVALSDGAASVGTSGNPLHVIGVVTQAVSGEVTADIGATGGLALDATLTGGTAKTQVTNFPATQPVSAAALPLPTGASQDATISARLGTLGQKAMAASTPVAIASDQGAVPVSAAALPLPAGAAQDATITARLGTLGQKTGAGSAPVVIASDQGAVPISAAALPLPTGAALDATVSARLGTLGQKTGTGSTPVVIASDQSAVPISAAALPLPTGAALDATLTGGAQKARVTDGTNTAAVKAASTAAVATDPALVVAVSPNNTVPISAAALPLPTGAAQDATLTARLGTVGQKTMAGSAPVVVASDQGAVPISAASLPLPTGAALDATLTGGTQKTKVTDGTNTANVKAASTAAVATDPALVVAVSPNNSVAITAAALPLPTGAALDATLTGGTQKTLVTDGTNTLGTAAHPVQVNVTNGTQSQPTGDAAARSLFVEPGDGTRTITVKAASTAAAAADTAEVVALSPNSPLPTGTNALGSVTVTGTPAMSATQGTAAALAGAWPVEVTDGTHTMPTADAAARALFAKVTDGTNALPTMDVAARAAFQKITDGTNTSAVKAASTAAVATDPALVVSLSPNSPVVQGTAAAVTSAWPVKLTDGTNTAPTGDVAARAGYERITDGTNTAAVKAASTAAVATDPALVVAVSPGTPIVTTLGNAQQTPLSNATVTASSSATYTGIGHKEFNLVVNVKNAPTGTLPTLTFQLQELDPGDQATAIGAAVVGTALAAAGTQTLKLADCTTGCVKVTWTIGGSATPSFTGVYATVSIRPTEDIIEQFAPVAEDNTNGVIAVCLKPLAVSTYAWTVGFSTALAASLIIKAAAGVLRSLRVRLDSTAASATYYIQLFNSTTLPADTTGTASMLVAPMKVQFTTGTDQTLTIDYTDAGIAFATGLVVVLSSTEFTKTIAGAYLSMSALYK